MEVSDNDLLSLLKTIEVLKPYLKEIVLVGGWVPLLYRRYGGMPSRHPSVRTMDIDIAVPRQVTEKPRRPTIDELLSSAGYRAHIYGSDSPVVKYELESPATEVEFLTPEIGRPGKPTITVQRSLKAQALRYLQIPLDNTQEIKINDKISGLRISVAARVPSPGAFVYHKGLTLPLRQSKVSKDLYYTFDILDSFPEMPESIATEINSLRSGYPTRWFSGFIGNLNKYFPESGAEGPNLVAMQYTGEMPTETFRNYAHRTFRNFIEALQGSKAR